MPPEPLHGRCCGRAGSLTKMCWGQARNWHTMPTSTTYDSRVGRLFNGFIAHRARSYTQSVCLSAGVRVPRGAGCAATVRQGVHRCFGAIAPGVARGLKLRHDHGP
jgi:hypothetical protein